MAQSVGGAKVYRRGFTLQEGVDGRRTNYRMAVVIGMDTITSDKSIWIGRKRNKDLNDFRIIPSCHITDSTIQPVSEKRHIVTALKGQVSQLR